MLGSASSGPLTWFRKARRNIVQSRKANQSAPSLSRASARPDIVQIVYLARLSVDEISVSWLNELSQRLSALEQVIDLPIDILQLISDFSSGPGIDFDLIPAGCAGNDRIALKLSGGALRLMAA